MFSRAFPLPQSNRRRQRRGYFPHTLPPAGMHARGTHRAQWRTAQELVNLLSPQIQEVTMTQQECELVGLPLQQRRRWEKSCPDIARLHALSSGLRWAVTLVATLIFG